MNGDVTSEQPGGGLVVPEELKPVGSGVSAPARRPNSVRRTSTIDFIWPDGAEGSSVLDGRARDLLTADSGAAVVLSEASLGLVADSGRIISSLQSRPRRVELQSLVGESSMGGFRRRLAGAVPEEIAAASPLHLLLDDVPGASLVSGTAHRCWYPPEKYLQLKADVKRRVMTDICAGYQQGSAALNRDGTLRWEQSRERAVEIESVDDRLAWHEHAEHTQMSMRRARRIDIWLDGELIHIDAYFQDSVTRPEGGRLVVHEYALTALADAETKTLRSVSPVARVLPYNECPLAVLNVTSLQGEPLRTLRPTVLQVLKGPRGCTHLNDILRSLADVPVLLSALLQPRAA